MLLKILFIISCIFNHKKYTKFRTLGNHIEMPTENDKNLYMLTRFYECSLVELHMDGFDSRYNNDEPSIEKLSQNLLKQQLLKTLEHPEISIHDKITIIDDFNFIFDKHHYDTNIFEGGLIDDWEFEI